MIKIRKSEERGHINHGWLDTYHTFSFGNYYDPNYMGFRSLRVINDDVIAPGQGFGSHPHRDMEIFTYILDGQLEHRDSMGNGNVLAAGDYQRMSAGTGIVHSEFNSSSTERVHLLQIWILPEKEGLQPGYEDYRFEDFSGLRVVASADGGEKTAKINQDARIIICRLNAGQSEIYHLKEGRGAWIHTATGEILLNENVLSAGDGAAVSDEIRLVMTAVKDSEILLFDLA